MSILRLSDIEKPTIGKGVALVMVGSFAPIHRGHFDAMLAAKKAIEDMNEDVSVVAMAPNSDSYVSIKLQDKTGEWNFERRISEFEKIDSQLMIPTFVDDISGLKPPEKTITEEVVKNVQTELGIKACNIVLVVGSDQVESMKPHLQSNRAVCVIRPGSTDQIKCLDDQVWFVDAVASGRYIITNRKNPYLDIASASIRNQIDKSMLVVDERLK